MKTKVVRLLKFFFPEWQIYDDYKKHGFISRNYKDRTSNNQSRMSQYNGS